MKKILMIAALTMVLGVGIATAASLSVPFFLDNAPTSVPFTGGIPGTANGLFTVNSFIGVKNVGTSATIVSVRYWDANGTEMTPTNNTFPLSANQGIGFRPIISDPTPEGTGTIVPKMATGTTATTSGSALLAAGELLSGRLVSNSPNGTRFAYLLDRLP
jgi:hypothetical protein